MNFLARYWFRKERLIATLPGQMKVMTEGEILQYYSGFLQKPLSTFEELLKEFKISPTELPVKECLPEEEVSVEGLHAQMKSHFSRLYPSKDKGMKILLIDVTRQYSGMDEGALEGFLHPPIGLMYLATYLHSNLPSRVQCKIVKSHSEFDSNEELVEIIREYEPSLVGLRSMTYYRDFMHEMVEYIKDSTDAPIIVGGAHPTTACERVLEDRNIDLVVLGEGEQTLLEIVQAMLDNDGSFPTADQLNGIQGIAFRGPAGKFEKLRGVSSIEVMNRGN